MASQRSPPISAPPQRVEASDAHDTNTAPRGTTHGSLARLISKFEIIDAMSAVGNKPSSQRSTSSNATTIRSPLTRGNSSERVATTGRREKTLATPVKSSGGSSRVSPTQEPKLSLRTQSERSRAETLQKSLSLIQGSQVTCESTKIVSVEPATPSVPPLRISRAKPPEQPNVPSARQSSVAERRRIFEMQIPRSPGPSRLTSPFEDLDC